MAVYRWLYLRSVINLNLGERDATKKTSPFSRMYSTLLFLYLTLLFDTFQAVHIRAQQSCKLMDESCFKNIEFEVHWIISWIFEFS